ncbi:hypothetical protein [Spongiimicrobium salis]|uniref:hypothetical protein n=1 Tax=Spongiimicrobium salis TaxID=1667022 RepID=UPI00374DB042
MKKIGLLFILTLHLSCAQNNKKKVTEEMMEISIAPKEKQITYAVHINAKTPYELFLDDIPISSFHESGMNTTIELNPYLLENGNHELKIKYLPRPDAEDGLLQPRHVYSSKDSKWNIFFIDFIKNKDKPLGYDGEIDYINSELEVVPPPQAVPFWEQVFPIEVKDLPFELEGWSNAQDLSKMDEKELKKEVVAFYQELRNLLNLGKIDQFLEMGNQKDSEIIIATYDEDQAWYRSEERINGLRTKCEGNMLPLEENLNLNLYANGRLVLLNRISPEGKKLSPLVARANGKKYGYQYFLYKPLGKEKFVIIRK